MCLSSFREFWRCFKLSYKSIRARYFNRRDKWGAIGEGSVIHNPSMVSGRQNIYIGNNVNIDWNNVLYVTKGRLIIKDNCIIAIGCTIITDNHKPQLGERLKDRGNDNLEGGEIVLNEDVWLGANVTLLSGVNIGRGAILGAGTCLKGKQIPPYAIVIGNPGRVIGFKMTPEEIIKHESFLYDENDRLSLSVLEKNYREFYIEKKEEIKRFTSL